MIMIYQILPILESVCPGEELLHILQSDELNCSNDCGYCDHVCSTDDLGYYGLHSQEIDQLLESVINVEHAKGNAQCTESIEVYLFLDLDV